jgi:hypothetical protein
MKALDTKIRGIRTKPWYFLEKGLKINQEIIEETVRNLRLERCPLCKGNLSTEDNFGTSLPSYLSSQDNSEERYCPNENVIVELSVHPYRGNTSGTEVYMKIYTNSKHAKEIAHSGELADISEPLDIGGLPHFFDYS